MSSPAVSDNGKEEEEVEEEAILDPGVWGRGEGSKKDDEDDDDDALRGFLFPVFDYKAIIPQHPLF